MGEIGLGWITCKKCNLDFPMVVKSTYPWIPEEDSNKQENLKEKPKYCPFCGSQELGCLHDTSYYG